MRVDKELYIYLNPIVHLQGFLPYAYLLTASVSRISESCSLRF